MSSTFSSATFPQRLTVVWLVVLLMSPPLAVRAQCRQYSTCSVCIADPSCGWCSRVDTCLEGSFLSSTFSTLCTIQLGTWYKFSCPANTCSNNLYCYDCAQAARCGWCSGSQACEYGNTRNSLKTASPCNLPTSDTQTVTAASWVYPTNLTAAIEDGTLEAKCFTDGSNGSSGLNTNLWLLVLIAPGIVGAVYGMRKLRKRWRNRYASRVEAIAIDNSGIITPQQQTLQPGSGMGQLRISPEHIDAAAAAGGGHNAPEEVVNKPSSPFHYPPRLHQQPMPPPTAFVTPPNRRRSSEGAT